MNADSYRFEIGSFKCLTIRDFQSTYAANAFFTNVSAKRLVLAFHFYPFPSLGHVTKMGTGWQWQPMEMIE